MSDSDQEETKGGYQNFGGLDDAAQEDFDNSGMPTDTRNNMEEEDPYHNDEQTYQEHFRKTFITENQKKMAEGTTKQTWTLHDMIIPAGKTAKLVRIKNPGDKDFRITEICDKLNGKALAGICRAAFRTDAFVIDSGVGSGIEKFCLRKNVNLIGVCPENEVTYPKINPNQRRDNELTNGHSHFFLIGDENKKFTINFWIASGRSKFGGNKSSCKIVTVILGDNPYCHRDIEISLNLGIPIVLLEGSDMANEILQLKDDFDSNLNHGNEREFNNSYASKKEVMQRLGGSRFIRCKESSEDLASIVHLMLAVTLF